MSVNSDEIAEGILKAVAPLLFIAACFYLLFSAPWLLWVLIPAGVLFVFVRAVWADLGEKSGMVHKLGSLLCWGGFLGLLAGGCSYLLSGPLTGKIVLWGGIAPLAIGGAVADWADRRNKRRAERASLKRIYNEIAKYTGHTEPKD